MPENKLKGLFLEINYKKSCFKIFKNFIVPQKLLLPQSFRYCLMTLQYILFINPTISP
jgi:hypothetical protein